jgi:hypothetical protein
MSYLLRSRLSPSRRYSHVGRYTASLGRNLLGRRRMPDALVAPATLRNHPVRKLQRDGDLVGFGRIVGHSYRAQIDPDAPG